MSIRVLAVGKKHEKWAVDGIERYTQRLRKPYDLEWKLHPHSSRDEAAARAEESTRMLGTIRPEEHVILLDERGKNLSSPDLAQHLQSRFDVGASVAMVIGGAYGVDEQLHGRADLVWSLSKLVFPHQLVRMILAEQIYRAQEISAGRPYHHV
ncbi:23S rRNA (pseudouridine(1915)-N(3))-methyltransferase RlmH [Nesterenkonia marinintestina]|uniref:23S rRNA (pseudouridine(1915)-N(3))-methyltransferase RlmH n=1 Tax=Nesterenkonia marinintestina TaxID=2979865 RepID=UPI0021C1C8B5|nr:23S rRNA (pseudouridine(1915)-N(3))-methyltransferase RlmH [Nesterenkonia sp. GX14115]